MRRGRASSARSTSTVSSTGCGIARVERCPIVGDRFAMRCTLLRLESGLGREAQYRSDVAGVRGVVNSRASETGTSVFAPSARNIMPCSDCATGRTGRFDSDARELVTKAQCRQSRWSTAPIQASSIASTSAPSSPLDQPAFDLRGNGRGELGRPPAPRRQTREPRQYEVLDAARHAIGALPEQLGDEERVALSRRVMPRANARPGGRALRPLRRKPRQVIRLTRLLGNSPIRPRKDVSASPHRRDRTSP